MVELTFVLNNGHKWVYEFDSVEEAERVARNTIELAGCMVTSYEIEEYEEFDDDDYSSNCHCDTYGFCGGTSCPQYWQCHSNN